MPTLEQARRLASDFETHYPDDLAEQLAWWSGSLGIGRSRLLRLMGLSAVEIARAKRRPWRSLIEAHSDRAAWLEDLLCQLLARYSYDWEALGKDLRDARASHRLGTRRPTHPKSFFPRSGFLIRPKEHRYSRSLMPSLRREDILLKEVRRGGPKSIDALKSLLSTA